MRMENNGDFPLESFAIIKCQLRLGNADSAIRFGFEALASLRAPVQSTGARLAKVGRAPLWKHPMTMLRMAEARCGCSAGGYNA